MVSLYRRLAYKAWVLRSWKGEQQDTTAAISHIYVILRDMRGMRDGNWKPRWYEIWDVVNDIFIKK